MTSCYCESFVTQYLHVMLKIHVEHNKKIDFEHNMCNGILFATFYCKQDFRGKIISRNSEAILPPRSPELTPLDNCMLIAYKQAIILRYLNWWSV